MRPFGTDDDIEVVFDRRQGERRKRVHSVIRERRKADRRQPSRVDFSEVHGFLGDGIKCKGDLTFRGVIRVDSHLEGELVRGEILVIGEQGQVHADIDVGSLQVRGELQGNINARQRVELHGSSRVIGMIRAPCVVIWKGAVFNGKCEMPSEQENEGGSSSSLASQAP